MTPETENQLNYAWVTMRAEVRRLTEENAALREMLGDDPRRQVTIVPDPGAPDDEQAAGA